MGILMNNQASRQHNRDNLLHIVPRETKLKAELSKEEAAITKHWPAVGGCAPQKYFWIFISFYLFLNSK